MEHDRSVPTSEQYKATRDWKLLPPELASVGRLENDLIEWMRRAQAGFAMLHRLGGQAYITDAELDEVFEAYNGQPVMEVIDVSPESDGYPGAIFQLVTLEQALENIEARKAAHGT